MLFVKSGRLFFDNLLFDLECTRLVLHLGDFEFGPTRNMVLFKLQMVCKPLLHVPTACDTGVKILPCIVGDFVHDCLVFWYICYVGLIEFFGAIELWHGVYISE